MSVLFIGKRFYTNRDGLLERFGRIYQLPYHWQKVGTATRLWLVDYRTRLFEERCDDGLQVTSTPVFSMAFMRRWREEAAILRGFTDSQSVVVASGDCYLGLLAYRIARLTGSRFVFDVYDKYDEFSGYRRLPGFDPFRFLIQHADARFFASHVLVEKMNVDAIVVPNGIDVGLFHELDKSESRRCLGLPLRERFVGYFGSMEVDRGIDDLIAALDLLRDKGEFIKLLIAGKKRSGLELDRQGVHYLGDLPHDRIPVAMASCDVLTLPYRRSVFLDMASSCKIAEYFAARRPVVATRSPNLLQNFPQQALDLSDRLAEPGDVAGLAWAIHQQLVEPKLVGDVDQWAWENIAEKARCAIFPI